MNLCSGIKVCALLYSEMCIHCQILLGIKKMFLRCSSGELGWCWTVCELLMHGFVMVSSLLVLRNCSKLVVLPLWEGSAVAEKAQFRPRWMHSCPWSSSCVDASTACLYITVRESSWILLVFPCAVDVHWCVSLTECCMECLNWLLDHWLWIPTAVWSLSCNHCCRWCSNFGDLQGCRVAAFCTMPAEKEVSWKEIININEDIRHWQTLTELGITSQSLSSLLASHLSELSDLSVIIIT